MANVNELPSWEDDIYLIGRTEPVSGGQDGVANRPIKQLANRTRFLFEQNERLDTDLSTRVSATRSFVDGATLESPRDEILYGNYRLVWTGNFPKIVPPDSEPATTGGIGAGAWAYTSDAGIRKDLRARDGLKRIGRCPDIAALRATMPEFDGQWIFLERAAPGGPLLTNVVATYIESMTEPDNGFSIFDSPASGKWVIDTSEYVNVWLAGFSPAENNIVECINKIAEWYVQKAISTRQINNKRQTVIIPVFNENAAPGEANYIWNGQAKIPPSLLQVHCCGSQLFDCPDKTVSPVVFSHEFEGLTEGMGNSHNGNSADAGGMAFTADGMATFRGTISVYRDSANAWVFDGDAQNVGLVVGNTSPGYLAVRDAIISKVKFIGFYGGWQWGHCDTYLCAIQDSNFAANVYGRYQPTATAANSGEGLRTYRVTVSNNARSNNYIDCNGHDYVDEAVHIDYAGGAGVEFGPNGACSMTLDVSPWIEGNDGMIISRPQSGNAGQSRVLVKAGKLVPLRHKVTYQGVRPIFECPQAKKLIVEMDMIDLNGRYAGYMCNNAYGSWTKPGDRTVVIARYRVSDTYKWLPSWIYGDGGYLLNALYLFTGTPGVALPAAKAAANAQSAWFWAFGSAGASVKYADPVMLDGVEYTPVAITMNSNSDYAYLYCNTEIQFPRNTNKLSLKLSVKCANAVGSVNVQGVIRALGNPVITVNGSTVTQAENLLSTVPGDSVDVLNDILIKPYLTVTNNDFVSTPPLQVNNFYKGSVTSNAGFMLSGWVGTAYILLPAVWFDNLHPNV
ncbi:hypothetical protein [Klebsiella quasipneumoniae]|uniref:tail fiber/spike domain-containing protein n=1 Tax=Klebsiella quasipneumoniae TaxID=1463165 RepID=UPI003DA1414C